MLLTVEISRSCKVQRPQCVHPRILRSYLVPGIPSQRSVFTNVFIIGVRVEILGHVREMVSNKLNDKQYGNTLSCSTAHCVPSSLMQQMLIMMVE
jgi:hypothetical protein